MVAEPIEFPSDDQGDPWRQVLARVRRDLRAAAVDMTLPEVRYLVDQYYTIQDFRIQATGQSRALDASGEPHLTTTFVGDGLVWIEDSIKAVMDRYTRSEPTGMGAWARCAPAGSMVRVGGRRAVPIESLSDGDAVISFNRHHQRLTRPRPVAVARRHFSGPLIGIRTADHCTETTPDHKWLVRLVRKDIGFVVYLMRSAEGRFRVGRSALFTRRGGDYWRLGIQARARQEHSDVWILKRCSTEREAAIYEEFIATQYGLTEWPFQPLTSNKTYIKADAIEELFAMLDADQQEERAVGCLIDHGLDIFNPLWSWTGDLAKQSPTHCMVTAAANLMPEVMEVPAPTSVYERIDWLPITAAPRREFDGPVYSLDVAEHHKYIQDDLITCNSIVGIGPVLSAGLLANVDIAHCVTVGHLWSFSGLNTTETWDKGQKRPWNARLKVLCWKIGESFVKVSGHKDDIYGKVYLNRKAYEQARNDSGALADQAKTKLERFKIGKDTDAYAAYSAGKLPPAHIHARAKRYAVKAFLADWWSEAYRRHHGTEPPLPYPLAHLGHAHYREGKGWLD